MLTLVTGANGHIGSRIVKQLLERGRKVRALVRRTSDLSGLKGLDMELVYGDVLDAAAWDAALDGVERVFHTAAVFNTRLNDESEMQRSNVEGTLRLLEALKRHPVERLVYTSS